MKILIWCGGALLFGLITTSLKYAGILLGGIPTGVLAFLIFWTAKKLCEKIEGKKTKRVDASWTVKVAMLGALATVLMLFEFPLPFIAPPFYEIDLSEVPVLIGAFALGPVAGVTIEAIKILLNFLINGTVTAGVGELANFAMGVVFVLPAALIYKRNKTKKSAVIGLVVGGMSMVVLGCFINAYIMLPTYAAAFNMPIEVIIGMATEIWSFVDTLFEFVVICVAPFNLIKVIITAIITMLVYKPLRRLIEKLEK